jgi:site-specific DNA recombinase
MPYLPVPLVEEYVERHMHTIGLTDDFADRTEAELNVALQQSQTTVREMNAAVTRQLQELKVKEERIIDLVADGDIPKTAAKQRLQQIGRDRERLEQEKHETDERMNIGADVLRHCVELLRDLGQLYADVPDKVRGLLCQALFEAVYLDEVTVTTSNLKEPFLTVHEVAQGRDKAEQGPEQHRTPGLSTEGSSNQLLAEAARFELAMGLTPKPA